MKKIDLLGRQTILIIIFFATVIPILCGDAFSQPLQHERSTRGKGPHQIVSGQKEAQIPINLPIGNNAYLTFIVNCHDFSDLDSSTKTVTKLLDLFEERHLKAEFYFTDQLFRDYMSKYPQIIERLKTLDMTISYHLRAPHPVTFKSPMTRYFESLPEEQLKEELRKYETYGVNPVTGEANKSGSGGYAYIKSVIGYAPPVAGLNAINTGFKKAELDVLKEMGLGMTIKGHEKQGLAMIGDIIVRPSNFAISKLPGNIPWYYSPSSVDVPSSFQGKNGFGLVILHENDFYSTKPGWRAYYYEILGENKCRGKLPPFDLTATSQWCQKKTETEQTVMWNKYIEILDYVVSHPEIKVVTSREIIKMVDENTAKGVQPSREVKKAVDSEVANLPLYLSFVIHNEEDTTAGGKPKPREPDYDGSEAILKHFSNAMREFGKLAARHGIKIDFGPEWTYIDGIKKYDPSFFQDMVNMGHHIEPHAHESHVLYGEIKERLKQFNIPIDPIASGTDESEMQGKMRYFDTIYPEITVFWGAAVPDHKGGEELTGYVWRPSRDNWLLHDPNGKYIYIGHGRQAPIIGEIQTAISEKDIGKINTYSIIDVTRAFKADPGTSGIPEQFTAPRGDPENWQTRLESWEKFFTQLDELVKSGQIQHKCLMEVKEIFEINESKLDMTIDLNNIPRSTRPIAHDPFGMRSKGKGKFKKGFPQEGFPPKKGQRKAEQYMF